MPHGPTKLSQNILSPGIWDGEWGPQGAHRCCPWGWHKVELIFVSETMIQHVTSQEDTEEGRVGKLFI